MARMHARKKGKSGSTKPSKISKPSWTIYKPKEIELLIIKLAKEGLTPSQIGLQLRDHYGIPNTKTIIGKTITFILDEKKLAGPLPEDLMAIIKKSVEIRKHIDENKQDMVAKRGLQLTESKIKRLVKYYKNAGKLPHDWKYDAKSIRLYVE